MSRSNNQMTGDRGDDAFYRSMPVFRGFANLMNPELYRPVPDGWLIGVADIVQSTQAIADNRYKAVNMAGASVIALSRTRWRAIFHLRSAATASFAVQSRMRTREAWPPPRRVPDLSSARGNWSRRSDPCTGLTSVARYAASPHVSYAMFSGGGLAWAETAMKRGEFTVPMAPPGAHPDLTGLSCRFSEMPAERGLILSVLIVPGASSDSAAFRHLIEDVVTLVEKSPGAGRPVPSSGPRLRWPTPGANFEAMTQRGGPLFVRRLGVHAWTLFAYLLFRLNIPAGGFVPKIYMQQVVENSDFRKYDDGLRMVLDCRPELADALEKRLAAAAAAGTARYGLHRQDAAMMTCFTLSVSARSFSFCRWCAGRLCLAATALKATLN